MLYYTPPSDRLRHIRNNTLDYASKIDTNLINRYLKHCTQLKPQGSIFPDPYPGNLRATWTKLKRFFTTFPTFDLYGVYIGTPVALDLYKDLHEYFHSHLEIPEKPGNYYINHRGDLFYLSRDQEGSIYRDLSLFEAQEYVRLNNMGTLKLEEGSLVLYKD